MTGSTKVFQQGDIVETRHTITGLEYDKEYEMKLFAVKSLIIVIYDQIKDDDSNKMLGK